MLDIIGKGALGLALLAAGAGLRFHELRATGATLALATVLKPAAMPARLWLSGTPQHVAVICAAVPTGRGAYILAKQMGGRRSPPASYRRRATLLLITILLGI